MGELDGESVLKEVAKFLARAGTLPVEAVAEPLDAVEALAADPRKLIQEVDRLRKQLDGKAKAKTRGTLEQPHGSLVRKRR